ncbi:MAG: hypothetical protein JJ885_09415 [Muricauda sp.]|nr:hypothetical protein [Allomuricauda sp.]MBO6531928.1 hypothetical protein [Allomuricauda sp.]MBO6588607.1 hypothetical protein [Allomuricauda sp.]MBO6618254.1 hypothetical protein [Allomuricauda sp.]MBO6644145.1 hypothetical protein [Allomuricauda sp.]MBO6747029.1 hypothetical protein [Allomuricauda sp.]
MKYRIILLAFCLIPFLSHAQWQERGGTFDLVHLERHQFQLNLLSPGFTYELGLFKNQSVSSNLGFGLATYEEGYVFGLAMNNRYRYYHNFNRRTRMDKNTSGNSGNYIAAAQAIFFSQLQISTNVDAVGDFNLGFFGMVYGIQRTYEKGFNFNVELGAGYYRGDGVPSGYGPLINVTLGWVATKRKKKNRF